jgi:hypothetical protein
MTLNDKIASILREHPEGEEFFDALDLMIRGDMDIVYSFLQFFKEFCDRNGASLKSIGIVLSGKFGQLLANNYMSEFGGFREVIIVNGGIRSGAPVELCKSHLKSISYFFLDDSFYSGITRDEIELALKEVDENACIIDTFVIYDGSKDAEKPPHSMYRYYNKKQNDYGTNM